MARDRMTMLFFELFSDLPRQGPGDVASTLRALALIPDVGAETRILDVGCGSGMQTIPLAQHTPATIVAIDHHPPFIEELKRRAVAAHVDARIDARVEDMRELRYPDGSFDLIWCEGAIYVVGFEEGLRSWHRLLTTGGHMAITEVCWMKDDVPPECAAFWEREYPAIADVPARLSTIERSGYEIAGHFPLPASAWWDDYYRPLEQNIAAFRKRHHGEADAQELADSVQQEIDLWKKYSDFYGYQFFIMRRRAATE